mmetsp:Transcript_32754/g.101405  ORF Transcript_32754/g.101405 Transcript_32754/m.101405 type:complete len:221 (+) Transcript_32754:341-1003(+)
MESADSDAAAVFRRFRGPGSGDFRRLHASNFRAYSSRSPADRCLYSAFTGLSSGSDDQCAFIFFERSMGANSGNFAFHASFSSRHQRSGALGYAGGGAEGASPSSESSPASASRSAIIAVHAAQSAFQRSFSARAASSYGFRSSSSMALYSAFSFFSSFPCGSVGFASRTALTFFRRQALYALSGFFGCGGGGDCAEAAAAPCFRRRSACATAAGSVLGT